jgi:molybdate transport system substrate-binding protein
LFRNQEMTAMKSAIVCAIGIVAISLTHGAVNAADVKLLSSAAIKPALDVLNPKFESASKNKVVARYVLTPEVPKLAESGEVFDVAIANPPHIDALIKSGKVTANSRAQVLRFGLGVGVRSGGSKPAVASADELRKTLLASKSVAYVGAGASGPFVTAMLTKLGILDDMKPKLRPGDIVQNLSAVAKGDVELVMMPAPLIRAFKGVDLVGLMPTEYRDYLVLAAGISAAAPEAAAGQAFISFLMASDADAALTSAGYERVK